MTLRRATEQLREGGSLPLLLAVLLIAASGDLSAQDRSRSRSNDSSDHGSRVAVPRSESAPRAPSTPPPSASPSRPPSDSDSSSASPSSPSRRRAVPGSPGEPRRQPSYRDRNDPDRHGGGDWSYRNNYRNHYPRWYGYYGPGWWWAPYGAWGWWLGDNYWPYGPHYDRDPYYHDRRSYGRDEVGALDLDVSPGRTQVHLDGQYIGTVDQYDGFPSYLWLDKGTYDVVFYLDGYKTLARQVSIYPGTVIDMDDRLEPGASVRPEDLATKTHERRDERLRYEGERRERIQRGESPYGDEDDRGWRDRVRRDREDRNRGEEIEIEIEDQDSRSDQGQGKGRLRLDVEPDDASIYLDGQFVGTARDLASLRRGLLVEPGKHTVAVVRPGRESVEREFEVDPGEDVDLEIELETADR